MNSLFGLNDWIPKLKFRLLALFFVVALFAVGFAFHRHQLDREAAIDRAIREIAAFDDDSRDPKTLFNLLLSLQKLGQSDAVEALRRYNRQDQYSPKPGIIIPLIFRLRQSTDKYPSPSFDRMGETFELTNDEWGYLDTELHGDIPFKTDCLVFASSRMGFDERYFIDWAGQNSAMRTELLTPSNDPFSVGDKLIDELLKREIDSRDQPAERVVNSMRETITRDIHHQVYAMLGHLIDDEDLSSWNDLNEEGKIWNRIRTRCAKNGMRWDTKSNQYEFTR